VGRDKTKQNKTKQNKPTVGRGGGGLGVLAHCSWGVPLPFDTTSSLPQLQGTTFCRLLAQRRPRQQRPQDMTRLVALKRQVFLQAAW
jgi:hypothetical protein